MEEQYRKHWEEIIELIKREMTQDKINQEVPEEVEKTAETKENTETVKERPTSKMEPPTTQKREEKRKENTEVQKRTQKEEETTKKRDGNLPHIVELKVELKVIYEKLIGLIEDHVELLNKHRKLKEVKEKEKNISKATQEEPRPQKEGDEMKENNITVKPIIGAVEGRSGDQHQNIKEKRKDNLRNVVNDTPKRKGINVPKRRLFRTTEEKDDNKNNQRRRDRSPSPRIRRKDQTEYRHEHDRRNNRSPEYRNEGNDRREGRRFHGYGYEK